MCIKLCVGILLAVLAFLFFVSGKKGKIIINGRKDFYRWYGINFIAILTTWVLIEFSEYSQSYFKAITGTASGYRRIVLLFLQEGIIITLTMFITSMIYIILINLFECHYFLKRHSWMKKLFFTIVCWLIIFIKTFEICMGKYSESILIEKERNVVSLIILSVQIWIVFAMDIDNIKCIKDKIKIEWDSFKNKVERDNAIHFMSSCFGTIFIFGSGYLIQFWGNQLWDVLFNSIYQVVVFAEMFFLFFTMIYKYYFKENKNRSRRILLKLLNANKTASFLDVEYEIENNEDQLIIVIKEKTVELNLSNTFSKEYKNELERVCGEEKVIITKKGKAKEQIYNEVERILLMKDQSRKDIIQKGWNLVNAQCKYEEIKKTQKIRDLNEKVDIYN